MSDEIAAIRGIQAGVDCASPSRHEVFGDVDSMLDFVEMLGDETGLPVGIKSAVGNMSFWDDLVELMGSGQRGVDFVNIDGGEGGTGAAPMVFADSVAYPFRVGFSEVYRRFAAAGLTDDVTFVGGGKLGLPENAVVAFALGVDVVQAGREAMLAVGCIQAQKCHTDHCPTGVATQNAWLQRGLDPTLKSVRAANYVDLAASRPAQGERGGRRRAPRADRCRRYRPAQRDPVHDVAARYLRLPAGWGELGPELQGRCAT